MWFWFAATVLCFILALGVQTPLHWLIGRLGSVGELHLHYPDRIRYLGLLSLAMVAGWGTAALEQDNRLWAGFAALLAAFGAAALLLGAPWTYVAVPLVGMGLAAVALRGRRVGQPHIPAVGRRVAIGALTLALCPLLAGELAFNNLRLGPDVIVYADAEEYFESDETARFLLDRSQSEPHFRYWGLTWTPPGVVYPTLGRHLLEPFRGALVWQQATWYGLYDMALYNPAHIPAYDALVTRVNRQRQDYHGGRLYERGLQSVNLISMMNVRYIPAPIGWVEGREEGVSLPAAYREVLRTRDAVVLENTHVLPRAWLVHRTRVLDGPEVFRAIEQGRLDPRSVAAVPSPIQELGSESQGDSVEIAHYDLDRVELDVRATSDALLVFSDLHLDGWRATVDGRPAEAMRANYLIRGVRVGAGRHTVVWTYTTPGASLGTALTAGALIFLGLAWGLVLRRPRGERSREDTESYERLRTTVSAAARTEASPARLMHTITFVRWLGTLARAGDGMLERRRMLAVGRVPRRR